jgi:Protein of unknown function (DUF2630)
VEDKQVIDRINQLAEEEHELYERGAEGNLSESDRDRLRKLEVTLDQCWDLLHQRRARRRAGMNPDDAQVRDPSTVEGYLG